MPVAVQSNTTVNIQVILMSGQDRHILTRVPASLIIPSILIAYYPTQAQEPSQVCQPGKLTSLSPFSTFFSGACKKKAYLLTKTLLNFSSRVSLSGIGNFIDAEVVTVPGTIVEQLLVPACLSNKGLGLGLSLAAPLDEFPIFIQQIGAK